MFFVILALALVWASTPGWAKPITCPPCPDGTKNISVLIAAQEQNDQPFQYTSTMRTYSPPDDAPSDGIYWMSDTSRLDTIFQTAAERCKRIKYLEISTHGVPGGAYFSANNQLDITTLAGAIPEGAGCAMAPDAFIHFDGCNIGKGCRGEDFLRELARRLLIKGGKVQANTYYSSTPLPGIIPHFSFDTQILTAASGPIISEWDDAPKTNADCRTELTDLTAELETLEKRIVACEVEEDLRSFLTMTKAKLAATTAYLDKHERDPMRLAYAQVPAAIDFFNTVNQGEIARGVFKKIGPCLTPTEVKALKKSNESAVRYLD